MTDEERPMGYADLMRLPPGAVIETPTGMTTAVRVGNAFRNGQPGWLINGDDRPISTRQLDCYGRGWRVQVSDHAGSESS